MNIFLKQLYDEHFFIHTNHYCIIKHTYGWYKYLSPPILIAIVYILSTKDTFPKTSKKYFVDTYAFVVGSKSHYSCSYQNLPDKSRSINQICIESCITNFVMIPTILLVIRYNIEKFHLVFYLLAKNQMSSTFDTSIFQIWLLSDK